MFTQTAVAQDRPIRIGTLYDLSGPFAAAGSIASSIGAGIAIDLINERGGVLGKHKVQPISADSQSKPEIAINEAERLISQEKLEIILGIYSSAHAVPLALKMEQARKVLWITTAVATSVVKDRNLTYTFRGQIHSDQYAQAGISFLAEHARSKLGIAAQDLRVAVIYEDGPYGTGIGTAYETHAKEKGFSIVLREGYSASAPDLSSLVTKLKRARPDVVYHTGYNQDVTLFLRQAREAGLRFKMLIGNGARYSQYDQLRESFGNDIEYFCNVDPVASQLLDPKSLAPEVGELTSVMVERYKAKTNAIDIPPYVSMGFNQTWVLLDKVLPLAITKHGGTTADAIRKAALEVDIPPNGTIQGYGVKFFPPGSPLSGQNERSTPAVMQYIGGKTTVVWPNDIRTHDPVLPLPATSPYAIR
jgi:branched-chain amino acid transport system substrate-binding protein